MARLIWAEPALDDLDAVAEYIALDNPVAAGSLVERVFKRVSQLARFPTSGKRPPELLRTLYREVVVPPCRIFYRVEGDTVLILHVMRAERLLRAFLLDERRKLKSTAVPE
ncbi:MAG: type II toxin-antitoxin system RelE/ParE family toxin [Acidobacteria bacterium]|nr:type II toxin-antitoxin system RelE/ParE family toxin [Acidobacteriota bacterium]